MIMKLLHTTTGLIGLVAWWMYFQGQVQFARAAWYVSTPSDANMAVGWALAVFAMGPLLVSYLLWAWRR